MTDRIPQSPPMILPVPTENRPLWSVMIPTYNCMGFLKDTLESVLAQDPGEEWMQIEVIDDHSTDGDVEALVQEVGRGRVRFFRQPANVGSLRNFETCLNRSQGHWVHLLHGDDQVKIGFYKEIKYLLDTYPQAGAAFTKNSYMNHRGYETGMERQIQDEPGLIDNWLTRIAGRQLIQPPSIVVKREVYEKLGSFFAVQYGEDWEMWTRIAAHYRVAYSPRCLAMYRVHSNNISSSSIASGQYIKDLKTVINIIQVYLPAEKRKPLKTHALKTKSIYFARHAHGVYLKNPQAALHYAKGALQLHTNPMTLFFVSLLYAKNLFRWQQKK